MIQFRDIYRNKRVLVTGHTGFKGSWLTLWLHEMGATIAGLSLDPEDTLNHWDMLDLAIDDLRVDIRDFAAVQSKIESFRPEIVFHLAAQPLVHYSYQHPLDNWSTNIMGTANILESCRKVDSVKAVIAITTDKVYENKEWPWGYRENDRLGGHDPYSASKAACEILIDSYRKSFFMTKGAPLIASARAGNVIGGGDWSSDRLIPDIVKSVTKNEKVHIRSPQSTRPWQHVLECLLGYLLLGEKLLKGNDRFAEAWNFGPDTDDNCTVETILNHMRTYWPELDWLQEPNAQPHETTLLYLDHAKARTYLDWHPVWHLEKALQITAQWYRAAHEKNLALSREQLSDYIKDGYLAGVTWIDS